MADLSLPRARRLILPCLLSVAALLALLAWSDRSEAQEPPAEPAAAAEAPAAAPAASAEPAKPKTEPKSRMWWVIESSGFIGLVLLLLSIYFVSTVTRLFFSMRQVVAAPPELVEELNELLGRREFKEIYALVKENPTYLGRLLSAGIAELPSGLAEARENMERVSEAITVEMETRISMLAVLGTLGPMIGLLGTLKGMIASFSVIALSDTQLKPAEVAGGISEALILTFEGVFLSVPAIYFFALFRNRVSTISVNTLLQADDFLRHFAHAARTKSPQAAVATAQAVPTAKPPKG
jgi:biopolymer transport protein ExbB